MEDINTRAFKWFSGNDTGMSSKAIAGHMTTGHSDGSYPHDPQDLGRCLRLLALIPEWQPRMAEMAKYGGAWIAMAERWNELAESMAAEVGIDWSKGRTATKTYNLMQKLRADGYRRDPNYECQFRKDGTLSSWQRKTGGSMIRLGSNATIEFGA